VGETSSSVLRPEKTKSLESSKRKRKTSEDTSDARIQAASSLTQLGQKKTKKAVKKVAAAIVQRVPYGFSDNEMANEPRQPSFSSCLCCALRFGVHPIYTPGSENEFVDVETFLDIVPEVRETAVNSAAEAKAGCSRALVTIDEASPKFTEDLEHTMQRSGDLVENPSLVENREEILEGQDPSPSVTAYNKSLVRLLEVNC
jgi:hypothetical protein